MENRKDNIMKKIFIFAFALITGSMAFTSCDNQNNNGKGSDPVNPTQVTAADFKGEWRMDSMIAPSYSHYERVLVEFKDPSVKDGILTFTGQEWDDEKWDYVDVSVSYEIVSFDRGIKFAALKEKDVKLLVWSEKEQKDIEVVEDVIHYFSTLPEITGKDLAVSEENIKGIWFEEYEEYRDGDQPLTKSVTPHYNFDYFGDNHEYLNLMAVELNPLNAFPHPGYWKFYNGGMKFIETYNGQTYENIDWETYGNFYKIDKLTDKFMVLHATWSGDYGSGEEFLYFSRTDMKKEDIIRDYNKD